MTTIVVAESETSTATAAWSRRVRRIGGLIQTAFAGFWLVRGSLAIGGVIGASLAGALGTVAVAVFAHGAKATAGTAPRPAGREASRLERAITAATLIQLAASFAAPAVAIRADQHQWVLPSIAVSVGPLLLWLDHLVGIPRYRLVGWALIAGPVVLVVALDGTALTASTGIAAGAILLVTATAGFRDLGAARRRLRTDRSGGRLLRPRRRSSSPAG
jgi:hypothetical protein